MQKIINQESDEYKKLMEEIELARNSVQTLCQNCRPTIDNQVYFTGEDVMRYLHISQRTLQNLRDNRIIVFTSIGGKLLYPEQELHETLISNLQSVKQL